MGYYILLEDSDFTIKAEHLDEAYKRLCDLNLRDELKSSYTFLSTRDDFVGSTGLEGTPHLHFSWMKNDYPLHYKTADEIFQALGFETETLQDGSLLLFHYDSKIGSEAHFTNAVSDLATGSLAWRGEDGERWKEVAGDDKLQIWTGVTTYERVT
jgi:hypothetical protein